MAVNRILRTCVCTPTCLKSSVQNSTELDDLARIASAAKRGRAFERLVYRVFEAHRYRVALQPAAAHPREADLFAVREDEFLIETRHRARQAGPEAIDELRVRLDRTPPHVVGLFVSISGFTDLATEMAADRRDRITLLMDGEDIRRAASGLVGLPALLRRKKRALIEEARVLLGPTDQKRMDTLALDRLPIPNSRPAVPAIVNHMWVTSERDTGTVVFVDDLPDVDWTNARGRGVGLDFDVPIETNDDLLGFFEVLRASGWITDAGRYSIAQTHATWHGFGLVGLLDALSSRHERYRVLESVHHTEEAVYYDICPGGAYTLWLQLSVTQRPRAVWHAALSCQVPGIPIDIGPYRRIIEEYDLDEAAFFRPLTEDYTRVRGRGFGQEFRLDVIDLIVASTQPNWVRGLIARNPFADNMDFGVGSEFIDPIRRADILVCRLSSWHETAPLPDWYFLRRIDVLHTADAAIFQVSADWHELVGSHPASINIQNLIRPPSTRRRNRSAARRH